MKLLITGANGFLGRYVVAEALRRGHTVSALCRSTDLSALGWAHHPNLHVVQADLRAKRGLSEAIAGVDAVLHLAAAKAGDLYAQYAGTVVATENLLSAMTEANICHIVLVSSFSVYEYLKLPSHSLLTEDSPIEKNAFDRDEYAHTKLVQERLVREHATASSWAFTILRPGVIYGKDNFFSARLGIQAGNTWIRTGAWARLPLTYVENCAEAIVLAAENKEPARGQTLNVVDDDPPTQRTYMQLLQQRTTPRPRVIPVSWSVMRFLAWSIGAFNKTFLKGQAKIPGLFVPARLHARCKPLRFTNAKIKSVLGWRPRYSLIESLSRSTKLSTLNLTQVNSSDLAKTGAGASTSEVAA